MKIDPFKISYPKQRIVEIKEKVEMFPWHEMPKEGGWSFGTNIDYMKNLADYWTKKYDWESQEFRLNQQPNYITKVDDIDIHFIFKKSSSPLSRFLKIIFPYIKVFRKSSSPISRFSKYHLLLYQGF